MSFSSLPDEILLHIFLYLDHAHVLKLSATNSHFYRLAHDGSIWKCMFDDAGFQLSQAEISLKVSYYTYYKHRVITDQNRARSTTVNSEVVFEGLHQSYRAFAITGGPNPTAVVAISRTKNVEICRLGETKAILPNSLETCSLAIIMSKSLSDQCIFSYKSSGRAAYRGWGEENSIAISGHQSGVINVWDMENARHIRRISGHQRPVKVLRPINGQPRLISGSSGGEVKLWDLQKGELVFLLDGFVDFGVTCLDVYDPPTISFTPLLAAGGSWSPIAKIWDLESGTAILLRGHTQYIQTIVVDRDVVYTGSMDTTVRTWCANTGESLSVICLHRSCVIYVRPSNNQLISVCVSGIILLHPLRDSVPQAPPNCRKLSEIITRADHSERHLLLGFADGSLHLVKLPKEGDGAIEIVGEPVPRLSSLHRCYSLDYGIVTFGRHAGHYLTSMVYHNFAPRIE